MARINLLPWREELRKQRRREFGFQIIGAVIIAALGVLYWHLHVESQIRFQNSRNDLLRKEIAVLDQAIKEIEELEKTRARLVQRMEVIQNLQASRPLIVRMFDQLVASIPEGVYLDSLQQSGANLMISGQTQSNARVSAYMRNIEASKFLGPAQLQIIESKEKQATGWGQFKVATSLVAPQPTAQQ